MMRRVQLRIRQRVVAASCIEDAAAAEKIKPPATIAGSKPHHYIRSNKMGKGDKRTAKGKRFKGSYGNSRDHKEVEAKKAAPAKPGKK